MNARIIFRMAIFAVSLLTVAPNRCLAMRSIGLISPKDAREMGVELKFTGNGPQVWVELEFKAEGKLKQFSHVELEINDANKLLLGWAPLKDRR